MGAEPDANELLLREIETAISAARKAFNAENWDEAALQIGFAGTQAGRLQDYLRPRLAGSYDPIIRGFG